MTNLIFDHEPRTWEELEDMVCQAFHEMGYESNRNKEKRLLILLRSIWYN
jgi:hypothetical protein